MEAVMQEPKSVGKTSSRKIKKVAVLGSGVMGSRIACHFANIGVQVLLLDIVPFDLTDEQKKDKKQRNRIVNDSLKHALKTNPAPLYDKTTVDRITTGNFDDDLAGIADCDWIIEVVIERLDIKKQVFEKVEKYRKEGTLITSNTSGIPIHQLTEGRSEDFVAHFAGTHFFNPPRYLKLLEIIPGPKTNPEVLDFLMGYGDRFLGKTMVLCKDTPAFIANRIGVFSIMAIFHLMQDMGLSVKEVDALTGPISGRPKSATFRTADVVGIDTLAKVANGVFDNCPKDEARGLFKLPEFVNKLIENGWLGTKSGQGFYKKSKNAEGKKEILALNLKTMEYEKPEKPRFASIGAAKPVEDLKERLKVLHSGKDKGAEFLNRLMYSVFSYSSNRLPEVSDEVYKIDDALKAGFGWELGPFETWDVLGVEKCLKAMKDSKLEPANWVDEMLAAGCKTFYKIENGQRKVYDPQTKKYVSIPGTEGMIILDNLRGNKAVWSNSGSTLHDIGDGVLCLEFQTKMNAIGSEVLEGMNKSVEIAEAEGWKGLVIGNDAPQFSAGANLMMIFMLAVEQEFDELDMAVRMFQQSTSRLRFSSIPVVSAPHGLTLGGGCETCLHSDKVVAAAETYMGLVESGVGLIPAGGGTKEMALRISDGFRKGDVELNAVSDTIVNIAMAKVGTSAHEAMDLGYLRQNLDRIVVNGSRVIQAAKQEVLDLHEAGYTAPMERKDIKVQGRTALGSIEAAVYAMKFGGYISEHDAKIAGKIAHVFCGGDLSSPTKVSETYLLDLEREAFLSLLTEPKTLERIQGLLQTGKPVRN